MNNNPRRNIRYLVAALAFSFLLPVSFAYAQNVNVAGEWDLRLVVPAPMTHSVATVVIDGQTYTQVVDGPEALQLITLRNLTVSQSSDGSIAGVGTHTQGSMSYTITIEGTVTGRDVSFTADIVETIVNSQQNIRNEGTERYTGTVPEGTSGCISGTLTGSFHGLCRQTNGTIESSCPYTGTFTAAYTPKPKPNSESTLGPVKDPQGHTKDPINIVTGNMYAQATDFSLPGRGLDFTFTRTYNSRSSRETSMGYGWTHAYNIKLAYNSATQEVQIWDGEGRRRDYASNGDGTYTNEYGDYSLLTKTATGFELKQKNGTKWVFDGQGALQKIQDRNANTITLQYNNLGLLSQATDASGRVLRFTHNSQGKLVRIDGVSGRQYGFEYDTAGNLVKVVNPEGGIFRYEYDANHNMVKKIDWRLKTVTFTYDAQDRCTSSSEEAGVARETVAFDSAAKKTVVTDSKNNKWTRYYNDDGMVVKAVDPLGYETLSGWDADQNLLTRTDPLGHITKFEYDNAGNLVKVIDAATGQAVMTYEPVFNKVLTMLDPAGALTRFEYDTRGNLLKATDAIGGKTQYTYNAAGQPLTITNPLGKTVQMSYDAAGNLNSVKDQLGNIIQYDHDAAGNIIEAIDQRGFSTTYEYDRRDLPVKITYPGAVSFLFEYDDSGNMVKKTGPDGAVEAKGYNQAGQVVSAVDPLGYSVKIEYDTTGNLISVTDQNLRKTTYEYDARGAKIKETNAAGYAKRSEYDAAGNRVKSIDAKGQTVNYEYDGLNRLAKITYPGATVSFTYDAVGRRTSMTDLNGKTVYTYDLAGRLTSVDGPGGNDLVEYTYDTAGNRLSMTAPGAKKTRYAYDAGNRLTTVTDWNNNSIKYTYDAAGNLVKREFPNSISESFVYNSRNQVSKSTTSKGAVILNTADFSYDPAGRRARAVGGTVTLDHTYDLRGQLLRDTWSGGTSFQIAYSYDPAGNRLTFSDGATSRQYAYNELNQLVEENIQYLRPAVKRTMVTGTVDSVSSLRSVSVNGALADLNGETFGAPISLATGKNTIVISAVNSLGNTINKTINVTYTPSAKITYAYDENGNLAKKTSGQSVTTYSYNAENRLVQVSAPFRSATMRYDGEGKRVSLTSGAISGGYMYDGMVPIEETDSRGAVTSAYLRDPERDGGVGGILGGMRPEGDFYYHSDLGGSVTSLTDSAGVKKAEYSRDAFGNILKQSGGVLNQFQFASKEVDPTGLVYFGERYYDPRIGRFITMDPSGMADGPNLYLYCLNDPVNFVDPWGLCVEVGYKKIIGFKGRQVNHTFIKVTSHGRVKEVGFDKGSVFYLPLVFRGILVPGKVQDEAPGERYKILSTDPDKAESVYNLVSSEAKKTRFYSLSGFNCYNWRNAVLKGAGIGIPDDNPLGGDNE